MLVVLNRDVGGFLITSEMADWLIKERNWVVISKEEFANTYKTKKFDINTLILEDWSTPYHWSPHSDSIELRQHKDLVDCVRHLKILHIDDDFPESHGTIHKLQIVDVVIDISIESYHAGHEKLNVSITENDLDLEEDS